MKSVQGSKFKVTFCHCDPESNRGRSNLRDRHGAKPLAMTFFNFALITATLHLASLGVLGTGFCTLHSKVLAVTPTASPSAQPTEAIDEKVTEIRQAIKDKVNQIKENVEKKAFVGEIVEVTDLVITITNFRGKQRIRIGSETAIIDSNRKEIKNKELEVEEKIIAMGTVGSNEILDAKRIVVVAKPKIVPVQKLIVFGTISVIDTKKSLITVTPLKNQDQQIEIQIDSKNTRIVGAVDQKTEIKLKSLGNDQKVMVIYPEPSADKTPVAKTIFVF